MKNNDEMRMEVAKAWQRFRNEDILEALHELGFDCEFRGKEYPDDIILTYGDIYLLLISWVNNKYKLYCRVEQDNENRV